MKIRLLPHYGLIIIFISTAFILNAQLPPAPATRIWTGAGDGHSWSNGNNWNMVYCTSQTGVVYGVYTPPSTGDIVEFISTGNISITGCPLIILGNVAYNSNGYNHCGGISSSQVNLYSMQIDPFSYVTLDATIIAGGSVGQASGTNISTALEIQEGRLTCQGLAGNYAQNGSSSPLNMNSVRAENSIIEITNPGTGGGFSPSGRSSFINTTITCTTFGPNSNNDYPTEKDMFNGCVINTAGAIFGPKCIAEIHNSTFNISGTLFNLNSYPTANSALLDNVQINVSANSPSLTFSYRFNNDGMKGNITCYSIDPSFKLRFVNGTQKAFVVDGNVILNSGSIMIQDASLNITGNLEMNGTPDPNFTKDVLINNQTVFQIGGSNNFVNYGYGFYGPIPGAFRFGLTFSGTTDSHIKWPIGFPADTLIIAKSGCAKVYFDNAPLLVSGKLQVNAGQLVLAAHSPSLYSMVDGGDVTIKNGGSILLQAGANISVAGNFIDSNTVNNVATCNAFSNSANNTVSFYNTQYSPTDRIIGSASNTSIGNVAFINQNNSPFTLQNNFVTNNFDLGNNGKVILGNYDFTINGTLNNSSNVKFFVTDGTGTLNLKNIGTSSVLFPIGPSPTSYNPVIITNNGSVDDFSARVQQGVYQNGLTGTPATSNAVNLSWLIDEANAGGSNASITTQWNMNNELPGFLRNNAFLSHFNNGTWDFGQRLNTVGTDPFSVTRTNLTSFSPFVVSNSNSVLPLTMVDLNAKIEGTLVRLVWTTTEEKNVAGFNVERSENGLNFSKLSFLQGKGSSGTVNVYDYNDEHPLQSKNYYRLKLIDQDGHFSYSRTAFIQINSIKDLLTIFPNPVSSQNILNIKFSNIESDKIIYTITNSSGKILMSAALSANIGLQTIPINIGRLPNGVYHLSITNGKASNNLKFIKN